MQFPSVLIISNRYDFSSDFICLELKKQNVDYLRINRDELKDYSIEFDPLKATIKGCYLNVDFFISNEHLKSIYFRAPVFLRDIFQDHIDDEEQLIRTQWTAFVRSLCIFENVKWFNNPTDIYKAEIKPYQLFLANKLGMRVPSTIISNEIKTNAFPSAIKSIDTAFINSQNDEAFIYTEIYRHGDLKNSKFKSPFFIQQGLIPKTDIRVTVVENQCVAIKIFSDHELDEDWRKTKDNLCYEIIELPSKIKNFCIDYVKYLKLNFGAIDLILHKDEFYFIEINPTGEWSWLQHATGFKFDNLIVNSLISANVPVS